jgi:hypothetical protein
LIQILTHIFHLRKQPLFTGNRISKKNHENRVHSFAGNVIFERLQNNGLKVTVKVLPKEIPVDATNYNSNYR